MDPTVTVTEVKTASLEVAGSMSGSWGPTLATCEVNYKEQNWQQKAHHQRFSWRHFLMCLGYKAQLSLHFWEHSNVDDTLLPVPWHGGLCWLQWAGFVGHDFLGWLRGYIHQCPHDGWGRGLSAAWLSRPCSLCYPDCPIPGKPESGQMCPFLLTVPRARAVPSFLLMTPSRTLTYLPSTVASLPPTINA
jgi:hypothetical protein